MGPAAQDPTGFPKFHETPPPAGPEPALDPAATGPDAIAQNGFRSQVKVGPDGQLHAVYYDRPATGDVVKYRSSRDGVNWSEAETVSQEDGRNWGPDLVVTAAGRVIVAWDRADDSFYGQGWLRERGPGGWETPVPITDGGPMELSSGHIAAVGDDLVYTYIERPMGQRSPFLAKWRWRRDGTWSSPEVISDGKADAWHSNIDPRGDGSVILGYDVGNGGSETVVYVAIGRGGKFEAPEDISTSSFRGERVHFSNDGKLDWLTWFRKVNTYPLHVYARGGTPGDWGPTVTLSEGLGGYHYDPFVVSRADGTTCVAWAWDGGAASAVLYRCQRDGSWTAAARLPAPASGKAELPSMDVDADGRFHVVWAQGVPGKTDVVHASFKP